MDIFTYGQRLQALRASTRMSARKFAQSIGVDPSQYSRTEKGNFKLSGPATEELTSKYNVNLNWLYTGEGEMLKTDLEGPQLESLVSEDALMSYQTSDGLRHNGIVTKSPFLTKSASDSETEVPYFDYDFIMGDGTGTSTTGGEVPTYVMRIQGFPHCISFPTFGDSMERLIKSGSIVFARLVEWKDYLEYGQIYGIVMSDNRRFLKYIRKSKNKEDTHFLLRSENEKYDDFEIPKHLIQKVWLIEGWINRTH